MPKYEITSPDGRRFEIEAPEGATQEQILSYAQQNFSNQSKQSAPEAQQPKQTQQTRSVGAGLLQGLVRDPLNAGAQMLSHALPEGVRRGIDSANNWLADKTGLVSRLPEGGIDEQIKQEEKAYQASRGGDSGMDWPRVAGNVASTLPISFLPGAQIQQGKKALDLANMLRAGFQGGLAGALQPVTEGDFAEEKLSQIGTGAGFGAASQPVAAAVGNVISPNVRPEIQALQKEGITPTPGQILGGNWQKAEDKLMSLPLLGDMIGSARERGREGLNRAAYARALQGTGIDPSDLPIGSEGIDTIKKALGQQYDDLLPRMAFRADDVFNSELANLRGMAQNLAPNEAARFEKILNQHLSKLSPNGGMQGETYKVLESALRNDAKKFAGATDAYQRELGDALNEASRIFKSAMERNNPQLAQELADVNRNYANYSILRRAGSAANSPESGFTPAQLAAAVKAGDRSVGKGATATGKALMQDLASAGRILESKTPDSGTAGRLMMAGAGGALAYADPTMAALLATGALPYTKAGGKAVNALLTKRPANAKQLADALRLAAPVTSAVIAEQ